VADEGDLQFLKPEEEYTVLVTIAYPDDVWDWCEQQGSGNPNGYIIGLIREDMQSRSQNPGRD
jgi:hypothetical protein